MKITVFKYELISLLAISTSTFCDDRHHIRNALQQHTEASKTEMLFRSSVDAQCRAHHWKHGLKQRKIFRTPAIPARAGLAQRLEGPSAWSGSPWGSLHSNAASGLQVLYLSLAALPSPSNLPFPSSAKQKALQCMEIQNCSPAISFMAVMGRPPLWHFSFFTWHKEIKSGVRISPEVSLCDENHWNN